MSYRDWHVGMKVVCTRDDWGGSPSPAPQAGSVYVIRDVYPYDAGYSGYKGFILRDAGVAIGIHGFGDNVYWFAGYFRPAETRKTDISIFTAMLSPERGKVEA